MLGILLLIFVSKKFNMLAKSYNKKNSWLYPVLAIVTYYASATLAIFVLVFLLEMNNPEALAGMNDTALGLLGVPFGVLAVYILYRGLNKSWANSFDSNEEILDVEA